MHSSTRDRGKLHFEGAFETVSAEADATRRKPARPAADRPLATVTDIVKGFVRLTDPSRETFQQHRDGCGLVRSKTGLRPSSLGIQ
jgi:hypothetical protein